MHGVYIEKLTHKGYKGFRIYHDSSYFKAKTLIHKDNDMAEKWIKALSEHAEFHEINKKYEKKQQIGRGKFSNVFISRCLETDDEVAMKVIDK